MTRKPYIKSSICALQNWGGYGSRAVIDNPLDKIYCALSWLLAAASAFVCPAIGSAPRRARRVTRASYWQFCSRRIRRVAFPPLVLPVVLQISLPLHFTPYTRIITNKK